MLSTLKPIIEDLVKFSKAYYSDGKMEVKKMLKRNFFAPCDEIESVIGFNSDENKHARG